MAKEIYTTEECPKCAHIFVRYMALVPPEEIRKRFASICPNCGVVYSVVKVHPNTKSL